MNIEQRLAQLESELVELKRQVKPALTGKGLEMVDFTNCEKPFKIAKYVVTQLLWSEVMDDIGEPLSILDVNLPKTQVSWNDAQEFIQKLNALTGKLYRLPTEYEWILAATVDNTIYSGSDNIDEVAWYAGSCNSIQAVGLKKSNTLGVYDMSGNVWEWCQDWYIKDKYRVIRGGSWCYRPAHSRVAFRNYDGPELRDLNLGFRLACDI